MDRRRCDRYKQSTQTPFHLDLPCVWEARRVEKAVCLFARCKSDVFVWFTMLVRSMLRKLLSHKEKSSMPVWNKKNGERELMLRPGVFRVRRKQRGF